MKHTITTRLVVLLLFAAGMAGCSEEDTLPGGNTTTPDSDRCPMTVSVADGGYTAIHPSAPGTRAVEDGYATTFTAGDKIGLYAVKDGNITASNICLTATESGSGGGLGNGIAWQIPEGTTLYYEGAGTKYFAYYPYQSALSGSPNASATDASGFFANVVSAWTPATDQGTYANYTAQDLMIAQGTLSGKALSFSMTHQMALVVIDLPRTNYKLSSDNNYTWTVDALGTQFIGFSPYRMDNGAYRYLVKPSADSNLSGSYTDSGNIKEWSFSPSSVSAGNYKVFQVDNAKVTEISHTLQVGDFYMNDGTLVGKDATLTDAQKQACIGVVYCVDNSFITDKSTKKTNGGYIHGLVVALKDASISSTWYNAGNAASNYGNTVATPSGGSGWYLPNWDELKYICWGNNSSQSTNGKGNLNTQFNKLSSGSAGDFANYFYWSSAEYNSGNAYYVDFYNGNADCGYKGNYRRVRSSLAF